MIGQRRASRRAENIFWPFRACSRVKFAVFYFSYNKKTLDSLTVVRRARLFMDRLPQIAAERYL
jgi:hypothetical protein